MSTTTSEQDHPTLVVIDREYQRLNEVLDNLSPEAMERAAFDPEFGSAPWTVKDLLVHMAAWKRNAIRVSEMVRSDPSSVPESGTPDEILEIKVDRFNRETYERWRGRSIDEALAEHRAAHEELVSALESLPRDLIPQPTSRNIWPYPAIWHVKMHRMDIMDAVG
ncbi:MAG TPA: DinB family protein [Actinomycetota bacterium]|nr:DinB family protein [Actinomycetota bacterium]